VNRKRILASIFCAVGLLVAGLLYSQEPTTPAPAATAPVATSPATPPGPAAAPQTQPAAAPAAATKTVPLAKPVIVPYDLQAYQVSITLGIAPGIGISNQESRRIEGLFARLIESRIGKWWQADIGLAPTSEPRSQAMLNSISLTAWNERMATSTADKRFALVVDRDGTAFRLSGLEWDRASQTITQIQTRSTYDHRLLPQLAADLTFALFRPLISIDVAVDKTVEMRIRGGEFLPPDISLQPFVPGEYISPFFRHLGKNRELTRVQQIPWTAVKVDFVDRGYMKGTVISAFASPLAGKRRRVESLGMKIKPQWPSTQLKVIPRGKPQAPMAGYRVEVLNRAETKEDPVPDRLKLRTDRNGEVVVPRDPAHPLQYLVVYSGKSSLAKAPLIPGYESRVVLSAPDDAPRMNVEAETDLLQSELIDIVAKREVLMARARGAAKKANWEQVTEITKEITALQTLEQFQARIEALKLPAIQAARQSKDKGQESRINLMCKQIATLATTHLDPLKVKEFLAEMEEEKKAQ